VSELLLGGELYDRIIQMKVFRERDAALVINQVLLALNYMHFQDIIHR
jgi:serine/threonine protein kinase